MKKLRSALVGALFICAAAYTVSNHMDFLSAAYESHRPATTQVITFNPGGGLLSFIERYSASRERGDTYVIDGMCVSACTMITGEIPADRVCITPYAKMGFHAAFTQGITGERVFSEDGTELLWEVYPESIKQLLIEHGWKKPQDDQPKLIWIGYDELRSIYQPCA